MTAGRRWLALALAIAIAACEAPPPVPIEVPCAVDPPAPYPAGSPYLGVHANRENNDVLEGCSTGTSFVQAWHALEGFGISQPNTFSPDGSITYVTTFGPDPGACNVWALSTDDGGTAWCLTVERSVGGSAVEVDADGALYFTADRFVYSTDGAGAMRWQAEIGEPPMGMDFGDSALGVHFTPDGWAATITAQGRVVLIDRADGSVVASIDLPIAYSFVARPGPMLVGGLRALLPDSVIADLELVFGPDATGDGLTSFLGAGGNFSDNTIAISSRNELFAVGGGPDEDHGALVQLRITGDPGAPSIEPGWALVTVEGSATSPSVSRDGRWVSVGDGSSLEAIANPRAASGRMLVADVDACDANTDADPDSARCAPAYEVALERGPIAGSPPLLPDGAVVLWELSVAQGLFSDDARDLAIVGQGGVVWETALPGGLDWTSVITVTDNHLIGTASDITAGIERIATVRLPTRLTSHVAVVDRRDGSLVFTGPIPDDSTATVTVGADGALYVGMFGLLVILASDQSPTLGLVRFSPTAPP